VYDDIQPLDYTRLRYALYVRKSTDDASKQFRSLKDQIAECEAMAQRLGIRLVKPYIKEKRSARRSNNRPKFSQLLKDIYGGKYDGIISWHPDRLARNMREGGEIVDMLDENIIKDLKFVSHHFTNDPDGKMLLIMAFAFSKRYSDGLSVNVTRGVRRNFQEGKSSGMPKYGYIRDDDGIYRPDGKNFELICEAWRMRKNGATYAEIANTMNSQGYGRRIKGTRAKNKGRVLQMSLKRLTVMFSDPFYYGVLVQAGKTIDLRAVPGYHFQPAVSEADWNSIQAMTGKRRSIMAKERKQFYPLRQMVHCAFCGKVMYVGASKSRRGTRYLYYRCHTKDCSRQPKSIRAKKIFDWIYDFIGEGLPLTQEEYDFYTTSLARLNERRRQRLALQLHSKQGALKAVQHDLTERSLAIVGYKKVSTVWKVNNEKITQLAAEQESLKHTIRRLKQRIRAIADNQLSIEQCLNLVKLAGSNLEEVGPIAKDRLCRKLFLNLAVNTETVVDFQMKEPFATLIKTHKFLSGGPEAKNLEPLDALYDAILQHWNSSELKGEADFANLSAPAYNASYEY
jgi:site-specific DNA recombinase